jgi:hypothetical protein
MDFPGDFDHPSWVTAATTIVAYGVILAVIFLLLFVVPYLLFRVLA